MKFKKLPTQIQSMIETIGMRMLLLEKRIKEEAKQQKMIEVMDKSELSKLTQGAEDSSETEDDSEDD